MSSGGGLLNKCLKPFVIIGKMGGTEGWWEGRETQTAALPGANALG